MSEWRKLALRLLPEHQDWIMDNHLTSNIYDLFFDLLPIVQEAHNKQNINLLENIYKFAEWCWEQKDTTPFLYNAVVVSFYEHLVEEDASLKEIQDWIKPVIFADMKIMFRERMSPRAYQELIDRYNRKYQTDFI